MFVCVGVSKLEKCKTFTNVNDNTQDEKESSDSHGNAQMFVGTEASVLH